MKQFNNIVLAICALSAFLASCTKEMRETDRVSSVSWRDIIIEGKQEGSDLTKTSIDGTSGKLYWGAGEAIIVFRGTAGARYVAQNTEKAAAVTFVYDSGSTEGSGDELYGLYPFDADATSDGTAVTTTLADTQTAAEGTFADNVFITMGKATTDNPAMGFYNVCGGVRFTVATEGITSVKFKGNNDEILAGKVKISIGSDGIPVVAEVVDGKKEVTLTCAGGFKPGVMYYITTLPAILTKGYTLTFISAEKTVARISENQTGIERSVFSSIENAEEDAVIDGYVSIPDAVFKAYCVANFDKNGDGEISYYEAKDVTHIEVDTKGIESLEGIEEFVNLRWLDCHLSYDHLDGLHYYDADGNEITGLRSLDVSKNTALVSLNCGGNRLTSLDVSKNTALNGLDCWGNQLTSLNISDNLALTYLDCMNNQLINLDVSKNTGLETLYCDGNQLTNLNVSNNIALRLMQCGGNQMTSLNVSNNIALTSLDCINNQLIDLDVSKNTALIALRCENNQLIRLDVSKNTVLTYLSCNSNQLTDLDVSYNIALVGLNCSLNQISSLDISANKQLESLRCWSNEEFSLWLAEGQTISGEFEYNPECTMINGKGVAVDMGLSVKWMNCNVHASHTYDGGEKFAWGELSRKDEYTIENYQFAYKIYWGVGGQYKWEYTKYVTDENYMLVPDQREELEWMDDAAYFWCGCRMPKKEEMDELIDNCTWVLTQRNGYSGYLVTSKINGNSIFLPSDSNQINDRGHYWTSTLAKGGMVTWDKWGEVISDNGGPNAWALYIDNEEYRCIGCARYAGFFVRPVRNR